MQLCLHKCSEYYAWATKIAQFDCAITCNCCVTRVKKGFVNSTSAVL